MLRELRVSGYRSLRAVTLELSPLTVVVGANGAGKTNLYQSLQLLQAAASGTLAQSLAAQGGLPSALWAGPRRKQEQSRVEVRVDLEDLAYELQVGQVPPQSGESGDLPSLFQRDPDVKEERLFVERHVVAERKGPGGFSRDADGKRVQFPFQLWGGESMLSQVIEPQRFPLLAEMRARLSRWRFYHSFRTDADAAARQPQVGVRTPALAHDGRDLAAALATIAEIGDGALMRKFAAEAFSGAALELSGNEGRFSFALRMPGLMRPLAPAELSDGMLRFLYLLAALLSPRPPPLLALNEPETSLHPDMIAPLAGLIDAAARRGQVFLVTHSEKLAAALDGATVRTAQLVGGATVLG